MPKAAVLGSKTFSQAKSLNLDYKRSATKCFFTNAYKLNIRP